MRIYKCQNCKVVQRISAFQVQFITCAFCGLISDKDKLKIKEIDNGGTDK